MAEMFYQDELSKTESKLREIELQKTSLEAQAKLLVEEKTKLESLVDKAKIDTQVWLISYCDSLGIDCDFENNGYISFCTRDKLKIMQSVKPHWVFDENIRTEFKFFADRFYTITKVIDTLKSVLKLPYESEKLLKLKHKVFNNVRGYCVNSEINKANLYICVDYALNDTAEVVIVKRTEDIANNTIMLPNDFQFVTRQIGYNFIDLDIVKKIEVNFDKLNELENQVDEVIKQIDNVKFTKY